MEPGHLNSGLGRGLFVVGGLVFTVLGIAGFLIPGLPGTPLLLVAAWLFSRSNHRLYHWLLSNRWFGSLLADYRAGLGIRRRIKIAAVAVVVAVLGLSVRFGLESPWTRAFVVGLGLVGIAFIITRPTRENVVGES